MFIQVPLEKRTLFVSFEFSRTRWWTDDDFALRPYGQNDDCVTGRYSQGREHEQGQGYTGHPDLPVLRRTQLYPALCLTLKKTRILGKRTMMHKSVFSGPKTNSNKYFT